MLELPTPLKSAQQHFILDPQVVQQIRYDQNTQPFAGDENVLSLEGVLFGRVVKVGKVVACVLYLRQKRGRVALPGDPRLDISGKALQQVCQALEK